MVLGLVPMVFSLASMGSGVMVCAFYRESEFVCWFRQMV